MYYFINLAVKCLELHSPVNGIVNTNGSSVYSVAKYSCFLRHRLSPKGIQGKRVCTIQGSWSGTEPECSKCCLLLVN